jgi:hypothetical protein
MDEKQELFFSSMILLKINQYAKKKLGRIINMFQQSFNDVHESVLIIQQRLIELKSITLFTVTLVDMAMYKEIEVAHRKKILE